MSKQGVEHRRRRGTILAMRTSDKRWVCPVFQFRDGQVADDVVTLLRLFEGTSP